MKKLLRRLAVPVFALALLGLASTGCFRHSAGAPVRPPAPAQLVKWNHHLIFGLVAINSHSMPNQMCGGRAVRVETYVGPLGLLAGIFTAGIWVPTTTRIWCGGPRAEIDPAPAPETAAN